MPRGLRIALQILCYGAFGTGVAYFATEPAYQQFPQEAAMIKFAFEHASARKGECRRYTPQELEAMPPNMRRPLDCPRGRVPLGVELEIDGRVVYRAEHEAAGLAADGPAMVYARFPVTAGPHTLVGRLRDSRRSEGYDYETALEVELAPLSIAVIDFDRNRGAFVRME
jgi:hypothetical protein